MPRVFKCSSQAPSLPIQLYLVDTFTYAASALAGQSRIPRSHLTLIDRHATYAHNDPNSAAPRNSFVKALIPFLRAIARR